MRAACCASRAIPIGLRQHGKDWHAAQTRPVGRLEFADRNLAHSGKALRHNLHVRLHDGVPEPAELLLVLPVDDVLELLPADLEVLK